jgi:hypothetical protein
MSVESFQSCSTNESLTYFGIVQSFKTSNVPLIFASGCVLVWKAF